LVKKGFPSFGITQCGTFVAALKNYNLPDFVLALVAKDCNSDLLERGRIDDRLTSMNDASLELLHKVFIVCDEDSSGKFAQYIKTLCNNSRDASNTKLPIINSSTFKQFRITIFSN
jgi:hypothetical protein